MLAEHKLSSTTLARHLCSQWQKFWICRNLDPAYNHQSMALPALHMLYSYEDLSSD